MMAAHTPGRWIAEPIPEEAHSDPDLLLPDEYVYWIVEERHAGQVLAAVEDVPRTPGQALANARLISAAPELLAALKALDKHFDFSGNEWVDPQFVLKLFREARAAIGKAEGAEVAA